MVAGVVVLSVRVISWDGSDLGLLGKRFVASVCRLKSSSSSHCQFSRQLS